MSLFHKLSDVYFDAVNLREAIESLPAQCDCQDADAHLKGQCCCAETERQRTSGKASCLGCLQHRQTLIKGRRGASQAFSTGVSCGESS